MSTQTRIRAHVTRMDRKDLFLVHDISAYRLKPVKTLDEKFTELVATLSSKFTGLTPRERKQLLNLTNLELTDAQFRRALRLALQS